MFIEDGTGTGSKVKVGTDNRIQARCTDEPQVIHFAELGKAYNWSTGLLSITGDATLMYIKNNSTETLILADFEIAAFDGITHSNAPYVTLVRNPTGGDLITDATAIGIEQNRNFGSASTANVNAYNGKVGGTLTGGNDIAHFYVNKTGKSSEHLDYLLAPGSSIGIKLTANLSSGSANYYLDVVGYFKDDLDSQ